MGKRGDMVENAITIPVVLLATFALVNLAMAGYASVAANNAANYAARVASVHQTDPVGAALAACSHALQAGIGQYNCSVSASTWPGGVVTVQVDWEVPNYFTGLLTIFGVSTEATIKGRAVSVFRKEGW